MSKAKGKKGAKKSGQNDNDEEKEILREQISRNTVRIEALERELFIRKEQTRQAVRTKNEVESRSEEFAQLIDSEKVDRSDIVASMTRQYKDMQDFLIAQNNELDQKIHKLEDQNEFLKLSYEKTNAEKDAIIEEKDKQIKAIQSKIDDMTQEFKEMLQGTLQKLTEKVSTAPEWSKDI